MLLGLGENKIMYNQCVSVCVYVCMCVCVIIMCA